MPNIPRVPPTLTIEREWLAAGKTRIAGIDEVGVGAIAGPVIAAAVVLPLVRDLDSVVARLAEVRDSNHVRRYKHPRLGGLIREVAGDDVALGIVDVPELEMIRDQSRAAQVASNRALAGLAEPPDLVMLDGGVELGASEFEVVQVPKVLNGTPSLTVAAASIIAMVAIAQTMAGYAEQYPGFGFEHHSGYPNSAHLGTLLKRGPLPIHHRFHRMVKEAFDKHPDR